MMVSFIIYPTFLCGLIGLQSYHATANLNVNEQGFIRSIVNNAHFSTLVLCLLKSTAPPLSSEKY